MACVLGDFHAAHMGEPRGRAQAPDVANEIIANMEVWRWMPRNLGQSRIDVNIPDFEVRVVRDGAVVLANRVVVGKPSTPTPVFSNTMKFVIVNPYWNVPPSILRKEMLPHLARDPYYLQRMGFEVLLLPRPSHGAPTAWREERARPDQVHVPQPLFGLSARHAAAPPLRGDERAFSHGCVRVDQPFDFAETILGRNGRKSASSDLSAARNAMSFCRSRCRSISNISRPMWMTMAICCCATISTAMSI